MERSSCPFAVSSTLAAPVEPPIGWLVELVQAGNHSRIPAEQLLGPVTLCLDGLVAERTHVIDLRLDVRARELLVHGQPILSRGVLACCVPYRRVEDEHGAGRAFGR